MHHLANLTITSNSSQPFTDQRPTPFHKGALPQIQEHANVNLTPVVNFEDQSHQLKLQNLQHGKIVTCKRLDFQAHCSPLASKDDVTLVLNAIHKFTRADAYAFAFRLNTDELNTEKPEAPREDPLILEGCEDGLTERGAGLKILNLLRKMEAENLVVIVSVKETSFKRFQPHIMPNEVLKMVGERAKELVLIVYDAVLTEEQKAQLKTGQNFFLKSDSLRSREHYSLSHTQHNLSLKLPDSPRVLDHTASIQRKYELSNTETAAELWTRYYSELNEIQYGHHVKKLFRLAYKIKKPMLVDMQAYQAAPSKAVEKITKFYCLLRGALHSCWKVIKQAFSPVRFRAEFLQLTKIFRSLPEDKIVYITNQLYEDKSLRGDVVSGVSGVAGVLLEWFKTLSVAYCGRDKFKDVHVMSDDEEEPPREDPNARVKPFETTKYTYGLRKKTKQEIEAEMKAVEEEEQEEEQAAQNQMDSLFFSPESGRVKNLNSDLFKSPFDTTKFLKELRSSRYRTNLPQIYKQYKDAIKKRAADRGSFLRSKAMVFGRREDPYHDPSQMLMPQKSILSYESKMRAASIDGSQRMKMQSEGGKTSMMSQSFNFSPRPSQMTGSRAQQRGFELKSAARSVLNEKDDQAFNHPRFNEIYNYKAMQDVVENFPADFNQIIKGNKNALDISEIPSEEADVLELSKRINLEDQNIQVLQAFAARMKAKRLRLFPLKDKSTWDIVD